jgi:hypothetical protein
MTDLSMLFIRINIVLSVLSILSGQVLTDNVLTDNVLTDNVFTDKLNNARENTSPPYGCTQVPMCEFGYCRFANNSMGCCDSNDAVYLYSTYGCVQIVSNNVATLQTINNVNILPRISRLETTLGTLNSYVTVNGVNMSLSMLLSQLQPIISGIVTMQILNMNFTINVTDDVVNNVIANNTVITNINDKVDANYTMLLWIAIVGLIISGISLIDNIVDKLFHYRHRRDFIAYKNNNYEMDNSDIGNSAIRNMDSVLLNRNSDMRNNDMRNMDSIPLNRKSVTISDGTSRSNMISVNGKDYYPVLTQSHALDDRIDNIPHVNHGE